MYIIGSDGGDIAMYNKNNGQFLNRVEFVIACYKRALSQSVRSYLEMKFPIEYNSGNKENFDLLRKEALSKYGGWTDIKGKRNYTDMLDIPNIVDIESADSAFLKLRVLIEERAGWNRKEEIYGDNFYRVWLKDHINDWSRLTPIHTQMELHEEVTFTQGRDLVMKLVDIDREERGMHAKTLEHIKLQRLKDSKTIQSSTGFTFVGNSVSMSVEDFEAMSVNYQPMLNRTREGVCFKCRQPGHIARECRVHKYQQSGYEPQSSRFIVPQHSTRVIYPQQQSRFSYSQQPIRDANAQSSSLATIHKPPSASHSQQRRMQPTSLQMEMFQNFMHQQEEEQLSNRKRISSGNMANTGQRSTKYANRGEWPPRGTGPPLIGAVGVQDEEGNANQEESALAGINEEYVPDNEELGAYFQSDEKGYNSDYN